MNEASPASKIEVALELLDSALGMFSSGRYFSSLHLAGATEEIFGEYLRRADQKSSLSSWCAEGVELVNALAGEEAWTNDSMGQCLKYAKNRTKHMNSSDDSEILFDPASEAKEVLDRAVSDFYQLMGVMELAETPLIQQFNSRGPRA